MKKLWPYLLLCVSSIVIAGGAIGVSGNTGGGIVGTSGKFDVLDAGVLNVEGSATLGRAGGTITLGAPSSVATINIGTTTGGSTTTNLAGNILLNNSLLCTGGSTISTCGSFSTGTGAGGYTAATTTGNNAFGVGTNGARIDFGAGANDYCSSDGTTVTFAGPVATQALTATSGTFTGVVALNSGAGTILTLGSDQFISWPAGGAKISGTGSGSLYESFGASTANIGGSICVNTTGVGNLGASGPDDLQTCTISANTLIVTGRCFEVKAFGTVANNANAKTVRLTIGPTPTAIITKQLNISVASTWKIEATICRTGASAQSFIAEAYNFGGTAVTSVEAATDYDEGVTGTLTQTETNSLVIKTQSTVSTTDNDIVSSMLIVKAL